MSDFVLQISGTRGAITLEPVGVIDGYGAQTLLDAVGSLRSDRAGAAGDQPRPDHGLHRRGLARPGRQRAARRGAGRRQLAPPPVLARLRPMGSA